MTARPPWTDGNDHRPHATLPDSPVAPPAVAAALLTDTHATLM